MTSVPAVTYTGNVLAIYSGLNEARSSVGAGLFAGGVVVGAAALPPTPNPGANPGVTVNSHGQVLSNQFAIDCYTSTSDTHPSE